MTGIFAVGGGLKFVFLTLFPLTSWLAFRFPPEAVGDALLGGAHWSPGSSPYFSTKFLMELYLVAALSFSIVSSRSLTSALRCASAEEMR